jgi:hypothetical protein
VTADQPMQSYPVGLLTLLDDRVVDVHDVRGFDKACRVLALSD